jgi:hypothetical protein
MTKTITITRGKGKEKGVTTIMGIDTLTAAELGTLSFHINEERKDYITEFVKADIESHHGKMSFKEFERNFKGISALVVESGMDAIREFVPEEKGA